MHPRPGSGKPRVLLLEAPYSYDMAALVVGDYFPLGIGYLAAVLRKAGYPVRVFQPPPGRPIEESLSRELSDFPPFLVGIGAMTPAYPNALRLFRFIRSRLDCRTVLGGAHASGVGERVLLDSPDIDYAVLGEGEQTLLELLSRLETGAGDLSDVQGLAWRDGTRPRRNAPRPFLEDLDGLPFPARDLVDMGRFRHHSYIDFGRRTATMITSRGCPFACAFCSSGLTLGKRYRWRSARSVLEEVRELVDVHGVDCVVFEDDTMTLRRDRFTEICEGIRSMPRRPAWYCLSRVDSFDEQLARQMKEAGCRMVSFGIESGSPEVLAKIGKKISIDQAVAAVAACRRVNIRTHCTFIVGFPFDTEETMRSTLEAARRIGPTIAAFFPLMPFPGTRIYEEYMRPELVPARPEEWARFVTIGEEAAVSLNPSFTATELQAIARRWTRKYYGDPRQWLRLLRTVQGPRELARLARCGLYLLGF